MFERLTTAIKCRDAGLLKSCFLESSSCLSWPLPPDFETGCLLPSYSAVFHVAGTGYIPLMSVLYSYGADVNASHPVFGCGPLQAAVFKLHIKMVQWLLAHGADPNQICFNGTTHLSVAKEFKNSSSQHDRSLGGKVVDILLSAGAKSARLRSGARLHIACIQKDYKTMSEILQEGPVHGISVPLPYEHSALPVLFAIIQDVCGESRTSWVPVRSGIVEAPKKRDPPPCQTLVGALIRRGARLATNFFVSRLPPRGWQPIVLRAVQDEVSCTFAFPTVLLSIMVGYLSRADVAEAILLSGTTRADIASVYELNSN